MQEKNNTRRGEIKLKFKLLRKKLNINILPHQLNFFLNTAK